MSVVVLNTVSPHSGVLTGSGLSKKSIKHEVKKIENIIGSGPTLVQRVQNLHLEKKKPIRFF